MEDSPKTCSECNAEIKPGSKFCTECGKPVVVIEEDTKVPEPTIKCPKCDTQLKAENKFCTECGTNINEYKPTAPPTATKIQTNTKITDSPQSHSSRPAKDDTMAELKETGFGIMKDVEKTGRGLMKDLGGFLDKSSNKPSKKIIKPAKKNQNFLVCDKCGGYYELQNGESADDFSHDCECGGHLELKNEHP